MYKNAKRRNFMTGRDSDASHRAVRRCPANGKPWGRCEITLRP
jgi:hypothetical protein